MSATEKRKPGQRGKAKFKKPRFDFDADLCNAFLKVKPVCPKRTRATVRTPGV